MRYFFLLLFLVLPVKAMHFENENFLEENSTKTNKKSHQFKYAAITKKGILVEPDGVLTSAAMVKCFYDPSVDKIEFFNPETNEQESIGIVRSTINFRSKLACLHLEKYVTVISPLPINVFQNSQELMGQVAEVVSFGPSVSNNNNNVQEEQMHWGQAPIKRKNKKTGAIEISLKMYDMARSFAPVENHIVSALVKEVIDNNGTHHFALIGLISKDLFLKTPVESKKMVSYVDLYKEHSDLFPSRQVDISSLSHAVELSSAFDINLANYDEIKSQCVRILDIWCLDVINPSSRDKLWSSAQHLYDYLTFLEQGKVKQADWKKTLYLKLQSEITSILQEVCSAIPLKKEDLRLWRKRVAASLIGEVLKKKEPPVQNASQNPYFLL